MKCHACDTTNPDHNRFCEACGASFSRLCAECGHHSGATARFCGGCGAALETADFALALRQRVSQGRAELKLASILFADIVSSTELIAHLDSEAAMQRLQPAILMMCDVIERFGGTIVRTLGDGVMALFGAPHALENHAELACSAALQLHDSFSQGGQGLLIRIGIHSGQVASDPESVDSGRGGGAHGLPVHLASRVMSLAEPGATLISADCHALTRAVFDARSLGHQMLKGLSAPVEVLLLTGIRPRLARRQFRQASAAGFHGRADELSALQQALRSSATGQAQSVLVVGAPGTGKSRLCHELAHWTQRGGIPVFEVRMQRHGNATPLQPVIDLMRGFLFRIQPGDDDSLARRRVQERLAEGGIEASDGLQLVWGVLGLAASLPVDVARAASAPRTPLLGLFARLVRHVATEPALVILEDLHWLDEASEPFLAALADGVRSSSTMILANSRPACPLVWTSRPELIRIDLAELETSAIQAVVRDLVSSRQSMDEVVNVVVRRSAGNPFFAEELVRSLDERGALLVDGRQSLEAVERTLPATVQAVIGARIDRLTPDQKSLLQTCAIIGREIPLEVLEQVAQASGVQLERGIAALCHAELLEPLADGDGHHFSFRHPLIQEVAYGTQLKARRMYVHAVVGRAMAQASARGPDRHAGLIAHHFEAAGEFLEAAQHSARAAQWLASTDSAQAISQWRKAHRLAVASDGDAGARGLRVMSCCQIALMGWRQGLRLEEVQPFIDEALGLASESDRSLLQLLLLVEGRMRHAIGGPADGYAQRARQALAMAEADGDRGRAAMIRAVLSQALGWAGLLNEALEVSEAALADITWVSAADHEFVGFNIAQWLHALRSRLFARLGRFDDADRSIESLHAGATTTIDPVVAQIVHLCHVDLARFRGDVVLALAHAERITQLRERHAIPYLGPASVYCRGLAASVAGRHMEALGEFTQALGYVRESNVAREYETEILASLAECHRSLDDPQSAAALATECIGLSEQRGTRLTLCRALIALAGARMDRPDPASAHDVPVLLARAGELVRVTGAQVHEAPLQKEQARCAKLWNARDVSAGDVARAE